MSQLSSQYSTARKISLELRQGLERLEASHSTQGAQGLARELKTKFQDLQKISREMERTWRVLVMQESASKRDLWKRKVEQIVEETDSLGLGIDRHFKKERRRQADESDRAELLMRLKGDDVARTMAEERGYDPESQAFESAGNSHRMVDDLLASGIGVLAALGEQRERMKTAQRKMFDVLNTTGLSDSLLRVASRRQSMDRMLVYGGMVFTVFFVSLLWYWTKH
mmetsp:Transcript_25270/g.42349  ORF Transcript_25270/g.42349 Transcript_25270/m.42349 type:complete len:225 (+) Transcript_25270:281-955(+)|eukprot:CAMPEP_0198213094 /NCGR_PEP_ID=MMETSP1445-20131203/28671_1 /TAXON_ID=36898 /ORGANISM="Pyramimonas sp., Strain CCMP2087" /LENGTH=224 /DNA_ID=CAMNT_0043887689 /DNA_START=276 /DNA_END=950 /DNA_ORIENTATION=+